MSETGYGGDCLPERQPYCRWTTGSPPEHPHPTPVVDCYASLEWLSTHAGDVGVTRPGSRSWATTQGGGVARSGRAVGEAAPRGPDVR